MCICCFILTLSTVIIHNITMILCLIYTTIMNRKMASKVLFDSVYYNTTEFPFQDSWKRIVKPCSTPALTSVNVHFLSCLIFKLLLKLEDNRRWKLQISSNYILLQLILLIIKYFSLRKQVYLRLNFKNRIVLKITQLKGNHFSISVSLELRITK